jgi:hypothetical protein
MPPVRVALVVLVVLALSGAVAWALRPAPSEAERVRETIRAAIAGAEAGDVGDVMAPLAEDFVAESGGGRVDRATVRALLTREFLRRGHISVLVGEIAVTVEGAEAEASFDAVLAESSNQLTDLLPVDADAWHLEVALHRSGEDWTVTRATRRELRLGEP